MMVTNMLKPSEVEEAIEVEAEAVDEEWDNPTRDKAALHASTATKRATGRRNATNA